nr:hypothetical protein HK105_000564 [Polyrhizophydium stewartii]
MLISHASASVSQLGLAPADLLGKPLATIAVDPDELAAAAARLLDPPGRHGSPACLPLRLRDAAGVICDADAAVRWVEPTEPDTADAAAPPAGEAPAMGTGPRPVEPAGSDAGAGGPGMAQASQQCPAGRMRLVIEIELARTRPPLRQPAARSFTLAGPGGRTLTLPTLETAFHRNASSVMRVLGEIQAHLALLPTAHDILVFMAQVVRRMGRFDSTAVMMLDELDVRCAFHDVDPDCPNPPESRITPGSTISKFVVSKKRWLQALSTPMPFMAEDCDAPISPIAAEAGEGLLPIRTLVLQPLRKFQTDYLASIRVRATVSMRVFVFGKPFANINPRCVLPMRVPFLFLGFLRQLAKITTESLECRIMSNQMHSERQFASQMLDLLGRDLGDREQFEPHASGLVRKAGLERLAKCISELMPMLGADVEIVRPGPDETEIECISRFLRKRRLTRVLHSRCCEAEFPEAASTGSSNGEGSIFRAIAGLLHVPLSKHGDAFIALLRRQNMELGMAKLLQVVFWSFVGSLLQREDGLRNEHLKTMLLANISHEVRTPLNAIVNFLEMMLDDPGGDSFRELWKLALDASRSVVHIISELLLVTETGWGAVQMRREPFRIMDCIRSCAGMFPAACKNRGLRFSLVMNESNRDAVVIGDQGKLRQVLTNLLGNAVKYTERGFVELRIESQALDNSTLEVTLGVRDSGMGIPESKHDAIFDAFERITDVGDKRSEIEGAGLGLSICAKLASLMNGPLTVESTENVGSTFTFVDNVANQRVVVLRLARDGHTTHVFNNGRALVDFVTSPEQPCVDLALVDLDMPGVQGTEVVRLIREAEANAGMPRIPVVAITASVSLADRDECIRAGMDGFLGKPLDFGVLRRMLNDIADGSWQRKADSILSVRPQSAHSNRSAAARIRLPVRLASANAEALLGVAAQDLVGRDFADALLPPADHARFLTAATASGHDALRLVVEIELAAAAQPPPLSMPQAVPAPATFAIKQSDPTLGPLPRDAPAPGSSGDAFVFPTLASGFHRSPGRLMNFLARLDRALAMQHTYLRLIGFCCRFLRLFTGFDRIDFVKTLIPMI